MHNISYNISLYIPHSYQHVLAPYITPVAPLEECPARPGVKESPGVAAKLAALHPLGVLCATQPSFGIGAWGETKRFI